MNRAIFPVFVLLGVVVNSAFSLDVDQIARRAQESAIAMSEKYHDPTWEILAREYLHPDINDSGIESRYPDFLPKIDLSDEHAICIYKTVAVGRTIVGSLKTRNDGVRTVCAVEIIYGVVARVEDRRIVPQSVQLRSQFLIMAVDQKDGNWKVLDVFPYTTHFYSVDYILSGGETAYGKDYILNLNKAKDLLIQNEETN